MANITNAPDIKIVRMDDWEMIYIDGKLVSEDHSHDAQDVLHMLGIKLEKHYPSEGAEAYTMCYGKLDGANTWEDFLKRSEELKDWEGPDD